MSKRDYEAFAAVIRKSLADADGPAAVDAVRAVARGIADVFAGKKSGRNNFLRDRFYEACGLTQR